jgi:hypothetical protein
MQSSEFERERIEAQSQAEDRRAEWQQPALRRIEAGSAEIGAILNPDAIGNS